MMEIPNRNPDRINERGNHLFDRHAPGDRYQYDFNLCKASDGWIQYDTEQDAWYFGVWVNVSKHLIVTFAEGDETICYCHNVEGLRAELSVMSDFYGPPPPAAVSINGDGSVTQYFDPQARPEV